MVGSMLLFKCFGSEISFLFFIFFFSFYLTWIQLLVLLIPSVGVESNESIHTNRHTHTQDAGCMKEQKIADTFWLQAIFTSVAFFLFSFKLLIGCYRNENIFCCICNIQQTQKCQINSRLEYQVLGISAIL